jgi:hypothetical protein
MRVSSDLSISLCKILDEDSRVAKGLFRLNRAALFRNLSTLAPKIPMTLDNVVFLWNFVDLGSAEIEQLTPAFALETFAATLLRPSRR